MEFGAIARARWQAASASSWQCRLKTLLRARWPKDSNSGIANSTPMIERLVRLPGVAARLAPLQDGELVAQDQDLGGLPCLLTLR